MPKIRTIKPELWTSPQLAECSRNARLLFIGMLNFCDDAGVHPASLKRLKMEVLPGDDCTTADVELWVNELIQQDLVFSYEVDGQYYWQVTGWHHQRIDKPNFKYPTPKKSENMATNPRLVSDQSKSTLRPVVEQSESSRGTLSEQTTTECNVMECNVNKTTCEVKTSPVSISESKSTNTQNQIVKSVFEHWQGVMNHDSAKFDNKRKRKILSALKLGFSEAELKKAIDGCASSEYHMGKNENKIRYDSIDLVFRDAEKIEGFIAMLKAQETNQVFAGAI